MLTLRLTTLEILEAIYAVPSRLIRDAALFDVLFIQARLPRRPPTSPPTCPPAPPSRGRPPAQGSGGAREGAARPGRQAASERGAITQLECRTLGLSP